MSNLPNLTHSERIQRSTQKRQHLLNYLCSEGWTDIQTAALLLGLSDDATGTTLRAMLRDELVVREEIEVNSGIVTVWGIAPRGIAECHPSPSRLVEHQIGRLRGANIKHNLGVQRLRLVAQRAGWTDWLSGRSVHETSLPIYPDAIATDPAGFRVAIELERNVKSAKRRAEVLAGHVQVMAQQKKWYRVLYVCDDRCRAETLEPLYMSQKKIRTSAGEAEFTDKHRARFQFVNFNDFHR